MTLARRDFLKCLGIGAGATGVSACDGDWSTVDRLVERALRGPGEEVLRQTICGLCEGGCGLTVRLVDGLPVGLRGNPRHPLSRGALCPVGQSGLEVLYAPERLRGPLRRGPGGEHQPVTWDAALGEIAGRLSTLRERRQGHRVAMLTSAPGRLFDDLARQFMATLGSASIASEREIATLPYRLSQGIDEVPGFDLAGADLVLSFGLDLFEDGPSPLYAISAMLGSRPDFERAALIHVGTRMSPTAGKAEEHLPVRPGTFAVLALGLAHVLVREGSVDRRFIVEHTFGFDDWTDDDGQHHRGFRRHVLENYYPDRVAQICGCEPTRIVRLARRFSRASTPVAIAGGEATAGSDATWNVLAVHALNALVGAFDRPGGVVLPPAMPFNPLPSTPEPVHPSCFAVPGGMVAKGAFAIDPVEAIIAAVLEGGTSGGGGVAGESGDGGDAGGSSSTIDVLFIVGTNPVYSSPLGERLRLALDRIPVVVALAPFPDETTAHADFVLPTHLFLESWSESTTPAGVPISVLGLGQPVLEPLFDTRHPADVLIELSRRADRGDPAALPWRRYDEYLKHRIRGLVVSGQGSVISGSFEESWVHFLEERGWRFLEHGDLDSFWRDLTREAGWWNPVRPLGDWSRMFQTPSGRYEFYSQILERRLLDLGAAIGGAAVTGADAMQAGSDALGLRSSGDVTCLPHHEAARGKGAGELWLVPFRPITARGRLGVRSPMVLEMFGYPVLSGWQTWVEIAPATAHELGLEDGDTVAVESDRAAIEAIVQVVPGTVPGVAAVPLGLGHRSTGGAASGIGTNPMDIVLSDRDLLSGTPALTSTRVRVHLLRRRRHGGPAPIEGGHA